MTFGNNLLKTVSKVVFFKKGFISTPVYCLKIIVWMLLLLMFTKIILMYYSLLLLLLLVVGKI